MAKNVFGWSTPIIAGFISTCVILLLFDNFTRTMFGFNVGNANFLRFLYLISFLSINIVLSRKFKEILEKDLFENRLIQAMVAALFLSSVFLWLPDFEKTSKIELMAVGHQITSKPNLLILSTDGLNVANMSAFGYERNTTPYIKSLIPGSLVSENHFTNAQITTASVAALLSGKLPTRTRMLRAPDTFKDKDIYQHFMGLLRELGYKTINLSVSGVATASDLNMKDAFDVHSDSIQQHFTIPDIYFGSIEQANFSHDITHRIFERLLHILSISNMNDKYAEMVYHQKYHENDAHKIHQLKRLISLTDAPFAAHVHLMGTHSPYFHPKTKIYSKGKKAVGGNDINFYDDAIRDYDDYVKDVCDHLKKTGKFENTIIVLNTDHSLALPRYFDRIPLIIRFPNQQHKGHITINTQRADIPPTFLDYIGMDKPKWMDGSSLISNTIEMSRPIITCFAANDMYFDHMHKIFMAKSKCLRPPFFTLAKIGVIHGSKIFILDLYSKEYISGDMRGHTAPLSEDVLMKEDQALRYIVQHLQENGYDTSSLDASVIAVNKKTPKQ